MSERDDVRVWKGILERWKGERLERQQQIIEHNREMLKLRVNGQAYRDRLVAERLRLRSDQ